MDLLPGYYHLTWPEDIYHMPLGNLLSLYMVWFFTKSVMLSFLSTILTIFQQSWCVSDSPDSCGHLTCLEI